MLLKTKTLFSIIITTFNNEDKIERAINSILTQNIESKYYEIIVVDDSSTDSTVSLAENYCSKNIKIIKLDKNSGGPSIPRNTGIQNANGKFVYFLDGDDFLAPNILSTIKNNKQLVQSDMVVGRTIRVNDNSQTVHARFMSCLNRYNHNINEIPYIYNHFGPPSKFIKLKVIKKNDISFPEHLHFGEDKLFFTQLYRYIDNVSTITESASFIDRTTSNQSLTITTNFYKKRDSDLYIIDYLLKQNNNDQNRKLIARFLEYDLLKSCNSYIFLNSNENQQLNYFSSLNKIFNIDLINNEIIPLISNEYKQVIQYIQQNDFNNFYNFFYWLKKGEKIIHYSDGNLFSTDAELNYFIPLIQCNLLNFIELEDKIILQILINGIKNDSITNLTLLSRINYNDDLTISNFELKNNILTASIKKESVSKLNQAIYNCIIVYDNFKHLNVKYGYQKKLHINGKNITFYTTVNGNLSIKIN
ncbi:glycosyltransferase family 2 protein [Mammaliicoccus lentus]|uniref:glycosyltransferase family 2 protein n=1 Tax=Mammaliicoccus lentus TaxID=42858 RepID=UPI003CEC887E